jgi:hypothetical protein
MAVVVVKTNATQKVKVAVQIICVALCEGGSSAVRAARRLFSH